MKTSATMAITSLLDTWMDASTARSLPMLADGAGDRSTFWRYVVTMADEDRLLGAKKLVAHQHLGSEEHAVRLRGGNLRQLREDAERLRVELRMSDHRGRPSPQAELFAFRERRRQMAARIFR